MVIHDGDTNSIGPNGFYPFYERINQTFSDMRVTVEDTIAEGDSACVRWSFIGKHSGSGLGIPPSGNTIRITGMTILRASGGKIVEAWQNWDMPGMMEQIQARDKKAATYIGAT